MKINQLLVLSLVSSQVVAVEFAPTLSYDARGVNAQIYRTESNEPLLPAHKIANDFAQFLVSPSKLDALEMMLPEQAEALKKAAVAKIVANPEAKIIDNKLVAVTKDDVVRTGGYFLRKLGGIIVRENPYRIAGPFTNPLANATYVAGKTTARSVAISFMYGKITKALSEQAAKRGLSVPEVIKQHTVLYSVAHYVAAQSLVYGLYKGCTRVGL
jgi:hypothetical protein